MQNARIFDIAAAHSNKLINHLTKGSEATIDVYGHYRKYILVKVNRDEVTNKKVFKFLNPYTNKVVEYTNGLLFYCIVAIDNSKIAENREKIASHKLGVTQSKLKDNLVSVKRNDRGNVGKVTMYCEPPKLNLVELNTILACCEFNHDPANAKHVQMEFAGEEWYFTEDYNRIFIGGM